MKIAKQINLEGASSELEATNCIQKQSFTKY